MKIAGVEKAGPNAKNVKRNIQAKNNANGKQPAVNEKTRGNHNNDSAVVTSLMSDHTFSV